MSNVTFPPSILKIIRAKLFCAAQCTVVITCVFQNTKQISWLTFSISIEFAVRRTIRCNVLYSGSEATYLFTANLGIISLQPALVIAGHYLVNNIKHKLPLNSIKTKIQRREKRSSSCQGGSR